MFVDSINESKSKRETRTKTRNTKENIENQFPRKEINEAYSRVESFVMLCVCCVHRSRFQSSNLT